MYAWVVTVELCSDLDVGACFLKRNVPIETFNISFECTQNKRNMGKDYQKNKGHQLNLFHLCSV